MTNDPVQIRRGTFDEIVDLRYDVLRAGLPREAAVFPGDYDETTCHFIAFDPSGIAGCVTLHASTWEHEPAWQLRGMATRADARGKGIGRAMLRFLEADRLAAGAAPRLWCNARVPAVGFYTRLGWEVVSDVFEIPTAGPHRRMLRRLP